MAYKKLRKDFYLLPCLAVARGLIGKVLVRKKGKKVYSGIIVETEAYLGDKDEASHSFNGVTKRNKVMFGEGGTAYVYFTYGAHHCINAVTGKKGLAHAVLIRALEPAEGIKYMVMNRGTENVYNLCSGPGKLCEAFDINLDQNGSDLNGDVIFIAEPSVKRTHTVIRTKRIGITKNPDKLFRFLDKCSPYVSGINSKKLQKNKTRTVK